MTWSLVFSLPLISIFSHVALFALVNVKGHIHGAGGGVGGAAGNDYRRAGFIEGEIAFGAIHVAQGIEVVVECARREGFARRHFQFHELYAFLNSGYLSNLSRFKY